uniref:CSON003140 protein n=2 Tax=Culicoides sonorensis TaxID=179676 RepID=A0A336MM01_CULSO
MHLKLKTLLWIMCLIFCYVQVTQASCLSYGHSCWGAHGKRSGPPPDEKLVEQVPDENSNRWQIIKILQDKNGFPIRKNYRKSMNLYRLGKIDEVPQPYIQLIPDDFRSDDQPRPVEALVETNNPDANEMLVNTVFDESLAAKPGHRVSKFYKSIDT